jgi:hypothetical protein
LLHSAGNLFFCSVVRAVKTVACRRSEVANRKKSLASLIDVLFKVYYRTPKIKPLSELKRYTFFVCDFVQSLSFEMNCESRSNRHELVMRGTSTLTINPNPTNMPLSIKTEAAHFRAELREMEGGRRRTALGDPNGMG